MMSSLTRTSPPQHRRARRRSLAAQKRIERQRRLERRLLNANRCVARGRIQAGLEGYLQIVRQNPRSFSHLNRLGDLLARTGRVDRAVTVFLRVARGYDEQGFGNKAIAIYRKILRHDPRRTEARQRLGELVDRRGLPREDRSAVAVDSGC